MGCSWQWVNNHWVKIVDNCNGKCTEPQVPGQGGQIEVVMCDP